jgi:hypothetical protein
MAAKGERGKDFMSQKWGTRDDLRDIGQELKDQLNTYDKIEDIVNKTLKVESLSLAAAKSASDINNKTTKDKLKSHKLDAEALDMAKDMVDSVKQRLAGFKKLIAGARLFKLVMLANPIFALTAIVVAIGVAFLKFQKAVADTRKELGVSAIEAAKLQTRFFALGVAGKAFGLEAEDMKESFDAIRSTFGGINEATNRFVLSLAKAKLFTGASAEDLARVISLQESISNASRETLLAQAKVTGELIRQAGVAPGAIFKDIAGNAEFFAQYAKDGGDNIVRAAVEARKLGLSMSQVASISDSLLDFETSIEKQLEASMLLGRQINLDRARQLALTGDQEGMLQEVLKQVGGEAEFNRMNVIQRKALAESVGVNVEELSRLVRNQATGAGATGQLTNNQATQQELMQDIANSSRKTSEHTEATANTSNKWYQELITEK